jgi:hypothetical protein
MALLSKYGALSVTNREMVGWPKWVPVILIDEGLPFQVAVGGRGHQLGKQLEGEEFHLGLD